MEVAKWLQECWERRRNWEERTGTKMEVDFRYQEMLILQDLAVFPEALLEIGFTAQSVVAILISKFAHELGRSRESSINGGAIYIDEVSVHERRTAYVLQIATYVRMVHIGEVLANRLHP